MSLEEEEIFNFVLLNESESQCVKELYTYCMAGNYPKILKMFENNDFSLRTLDKALRLCLINNKRDHSNYRDSIDLLLAHVNINYKNAFDNNSTILMLACYLGDYNVCKQILLYDYNESPLTVNKKIEVNEIDDRGRNILHYLISGKSSEEEILEIFDLLIQNSNFQYKMNFNEFILESIKIQNKEDPLNIDESGRIVSKIEPLFNFDLMTAINAEDFKGYNSLSLALKNGFYFVSKKLITLGANLNHIIRSSNNNLIFCAIEGKNLNCLYLILKFMKSDDVHHKNNENLTPIDFARENKLSYFANIIQNFESNYNNNLYKSLIKNKEFITQFDVLDKFNKKKYKDALFLMEQLKLNQSIVNFDSTIIDFNILLTQYHNELSRFDGNFREEHILSKFIGNSEINKFQEILTFLINLSFEPKNDEILNYNILFLNKGFVYLKSGLYYKATEIFVEILQRFEEEGDDTVKWILYYHVSFILIEILIKFGFFNLVKIILNTFHKNIFTSYIEKKDQKYCAEDAYISEYLNSNEFLNKFSPTWDESFCLMNVYMSLNSICLNEYQEADKSLVQLKRLINHCKYKEEAPIFENLKFFLMFLKIKVVCCTKKYTKAFKKINKISSIIYEKGYNLKIENITFKKEEYSFKYFVCTFNSLGINALKLEDYNLAEFYFKKALFYQITAVKQIQNVTYAFDLRITEYYEIKYNLALAYFLQKKYSQSFKTFETIKDNIGANKYIFVVYRMAICLKELAIEHIKQCSQKHYSDVVEKTIGFNDSNDCDIENKEKQQFHRILLKNHSKSKSLNDNNKKSNKLRHAIEYFKEVLSFYYSKNNQTQNFKENLEKINSFYDRDNENSLTDYKQQTITPNLDKVCQNSFINLIFLLILKEEYSEALFLCTRHDLTKNLDKVNKSRIENYKIQCLINLNNQKLASEIIEEQLNSKNDIIIDFFNGTNQIFVKSLSTKIALQVNLVKIFFQQNKLDEARNLLNKLINMYQMNKEEEIPAYIKNLTIYYYMLKGKYDIVFSIIKKNKVDLIKDNNNL